MSWQDHGPDLSRPEAGETGMLASDNDRDGVVGVLNEAFAEGRLTADEHGGRVRAAYAARTWHELGRLTMDLPGPGDAAGEAAGAPDKLDRCLLCALLIACPPAGIACLLISRRRARAARRHALSAGPSSSGYGGAAVQAEAERDAENR